MLNLEKIIHIDGKDILFKSTGATALRYKAQFHRDFFAEIVKMAVLEEILTGKIGEADPEKIDLEIFYRISWVMAKTADKNIQPMMEWLDSFDEFPIFDVIEQINDLIASMFQTTKKK